MASFLEYSEIPQLTEPLLTWPELTRWGRRPEPATPTRPPSGGGAGGALWGEPVPEREIKLPDRKKRLRLKLQKDEQDIIDFITATAGFY